MRNDISGKSTQFINPAQHHIYLVTLNNKERTKFNVNYTEIHDLVGEEEWMKGEIKSIVFATLEDAKLLFCLGEQSRIHKMVTDNHW